VGEAEVLPDQTVPVPQTAEAVATA
jgi:hypothetical protein